jgi:uncharacterized membrane protein
MNLIDIILLSLTFVFIVIAIHQMMLGGFANGYWAVMLAFIFFFSYNYRKRK